MVASLAGNVNPSAATPWIDATVPAGIEGQSLSRLKFADLNGDRRPDAILLPKSKQGTLPRVFPNRSEDSDGKIGFRLKAKTETSLPLVRTADTLVFADLNNGGIKDAILVRDNDIYQDDYAPSESYPQHSSWFLGNGDGSFNEARVFKEAPMVTTRAIAVGDVNQDGLLDCLMGNWYQRYFTGYEAFSNDLLIQHSTTGGIPEFARWPVPHETSPTDFHDDLGGRPTYGVALPCFNDGLPMVLELNYGRRWNRLYRMTRRGPLKEIPSNEESPSALIPQPTPLKLKYNDQGRIKHLLNWETSGWGDTLSARRNPSSSYYLGNPKSN